MHDARTPVKLDFTSGFETLPIRPKADESTTQASVAAGRELGFSARVAIPSYAPSVGPVATPAIDGRRLRSRGANTQFNLKVTQAEKDMILQEATRHIQNPTSPVSNIGEFVVLAVSFYKAQGTQ